LDDPLYKQTTQFWGKKNYKKMSNAFPPSKRIVLEFESNVVYFNFLKSEIKKLFQIFTHFQTEGIENPKSKTDQIGSYKTLKNLYMCQYLKFNN